MTGWPPPDERPAGPLVTCLVTLAGTPDDEPGVEAQLVAIAQLVTDRVAAVTYASVTALREGAYTTVTASSDIAIAVDEAQYADGTGPCLDALFAQAPVVVPDIRGAVVWPGFRETAYQLGLRASLSIPLFAGRGTPVAALNLYGRQPAAMAPLAAAVMDAYAEEAAGAKPRELDEGSLSLVTGLTGAFAARGLIQRAIGLLIAVDRITADAAYEVLRVRATRTGCSLSDTAAALVTDTAARPAPGGRKRSPGPGGPERGGLN